jgi:membrane associated rhomboid family serine protease
MFLLFPAGSDKTLYGVPWFTAGVAGLCILIQLAGSFGVFDPIAVLGYAPSSGISPNLLLCTFAHAGWFHLIGNLLFLWCMGVNLELRWGPAWFAGLYLLGGVASTFAYTVLHAGSAVPLVGASGAIAAAMGAFLVSLFKTRITWFYAYWLLFRGGAGRFTVRAYVVLPLWFLTDVLGSLGEANGGGVAYSAHVSGFLFGAALASAFRFSGMEKKVLEDRGVDVFDDPRLWAQVPQEGAEPHPEPLAIAGTSPAQRQRMAPPPSAAAKKCGGCGLVNMADATSCRRCSTAL